MTCELPVLHYRTFVLSMSRRSFLPNPYPSSKVACLHSNPTRAHQSGPALRLVPARPSRGGARRGRPAEAGANPDPDSFAPRPSVDGRARGARATPRDLDGAGAADRGYSALAHTDTARQPGG